MSAPIEHVFSVTTESLQGFSRFSDPGNVADDCQWVSNVRKIISDGKNNLLISGKHEAYVFLCNEISFNTFVNCKKNCDCEVT